MDDTTTTNGFTDMDETADSVSEAVPKYRGQSSLPFEEGKRYTYADYCQWPNQIDGRFVQYELIDGIPFVMNSPNMRHQKINMRISLQLGFFLKDKPCDVYNVPVDVRMNFDTADDTVVIPDILVICDHSKLTKAGCNGAPDMVIEILSPSTAQRDRLLKLQVYEKYGVREYWIVDPKTDMVTVYLRENGQLHLKSYGDATVIPVSILEGCEIDLTEVFAE